MRIICRGIHAGEGRFAYPYAYTSDVSWAPRPACGPPAAPLAPMPYSMSGPAYKGMDPSDPATYARPWNPQPGMIALLNFDGACSRAAPPRSCAAAPSSASPGS